MRLVQYALRSNRAEAASPGVLRTDGTVVPLSSLLGVDSPGSVRELLAAGPGMLDALRRMLEEDHHAAVPADDVVLEMPLGREPLVVCAGANYRAHVEEMGAGSLGSAPCFIKNSNAIVGPGDDIELPASASEQVDWEGELAVVIGAPCHSVRAADAWDYVAGFTLLNDVSARDDVPALGAARTGFEGLSAGLKMLMGKQYPTFAPLGPAVVTCDEVPDIATVRLTTTVNGQLMQDALVGDLTVDIPALVEAYSRYFRFEPGDVISTGSPAGVGAGQQPPRFLTDGDVVTVAATGIGELTNTVRKSTASS